MRRASLKETEPGSLLGQSILDAKGNILLTAGTALTERYVRTLLEADGPADRGGLLLGDVVILFGGEAIRDTGDLQTALRADRIGQAIAVRVVRGGEARDLTVTVGERPT